MVQVFHLNRRLLHCKFVSIVCLVIFLIFIHTFEITYHLWNTCPENERIDVVYTWVNGSDPKFVKELKFYLRKNAGGQVDSSKQRYSDKDELKFSLRSLEKYASWIGHVYVVTNGQIPYWLNLDCEKISLVTHEEIFRDKYNLPTFSSPAIEANLHRIPGLSKRFIYFNDDVFLRSPVFKDDFVSPSRGFLLYLAWLLPMCAPECSWLYVADGHCDDSCNNAKCQMDGGDCDETSKTLLGDVLVKFDEYELPEVQAVKEERALASLPNLTMKNLSKMGLPDARTNLSLLISEYNKKILLFDKLKRNKFRRKLSEKFKKFKYLNVDAYAESLQHTNRMLNDFYGFSLRKVPAHAPILIDRDIMEKMQQKFWKFFEKTSRNRIRSIDDVQFAFSYYHFLIHEKRELEVGEIFDELDTDSSGIWSDIEVRTVVTKLYDLPITDQVFNHFTHMVVNCSSHAELPTLQITKDFVRNCPILSSFLRSALGIRHKYKFEMIRDAEKKYVFFKMLNSNVSQVIRELDEIRKDEKKFVCLNDNLDQSRTSDNEIIHSLMLDFYTSLFPTRSQFELPPQYRNRFLYIEDYRSLLANQQRRFIVACFFVIVIIVASFLNFFRRRFCELIKKCFLL